MANSIHEGDISLAIIEEPSLAQEEENKKDLIVSQHEDSNNVAVDSGDKISIEQENEKEEPSPESNHEELNHDTTDLNVSADQQLLPKQEDDKDANGVTISDNKKANKKCKLPKYLQPFLPPRSSPAKYLTRIIACVVIGAALYSVIGKDAYPGGNIFSIYIMLIVATLGGFCVKLKTPWFQFPPLLGMLIVGFVTRSISGINLNRNIEKEWSRVLRLLALCVILLRSGLGLDIAALKRLKFTVLRLAFMPCISEAVTVAIVARFLLNMPWLWAFQLGFILGAVSPAVVVPSMLGLQEKGYGVDQGIPTLVMAASSCDDVLAISMFGVFLGITFSEGSMIFNIFRGPLEILMGISAGVLIGALLWYLPASTTKDKSDAAQDGGSADDNGDTEKYEGDVTPNRAVLLIAFGVMFLFGSDRIQFPGAGALGVLCLGATAAYGWGEGKAPVERILRVLWELFQPLLFGLIGAQVSTDYLKMSLVGKGIALMFIALIIRFIVTFVVVAGNNMNVKEKIFCVIAWLPKATVQAAIGSVPLDTIDRLNKGKEEREYGIQILTIAFLAILITAPIGAICISVTGPLFLKKKPTKKDVEKGKDRGSEETEDKAVENVEDVGTEKTEDRSADDKDTEKANNEDHAHLTT